MKLGHIAKHFLHRQVRDIDDSKRGHIDEVIFKVLQIERFYIESGEKIMVLVVVHLQLEDLHIRKDIIIELYKKNYRPPSENVAC